MHESALPLCKKIIDKVYGRKILNGGASKHLYVILDIRRNMKVGRKVLVTSSEDEQNNVGMHKSHSIAILQSAYIDCRMSIYVPTNNGSIVGPKKELYNKVAYLSKAQYIKNTLLAIYFIDTI